MSSPDHLCRVSAKSNLLPAQRLSNANLDILGQERLQDRLLEPTRSHDDNDTRHQWCLQIPGPALQMGTHYYPEQRCQHASRWSMLEESSLDNSSNVHLGILQHRLNLRCRIVYYLVHGQWHRPLWMVSFGSGIE
jgi:hypothetical protein